jgi:cation transport ATPase
MADEGKEQQEQEKKEESQEHHEHAHEKKEERPEKEEKRHEPSHKKGSEKEATEQLQAPSEKRDLRDSRISMLLFILAGTAVGLLSSILHSSGISNWMTVPAGIVILMVLANGMAKLFRRKLKFFYGGLFVYLFVWLVAWIFLYNM